MHEHQCNICGGFEKIDACAHCLHAVCENCKSNHEPYCEMAKKMKARGEGPTIANVPQGEHRRGHETPPTTPPDRRTTKAEILGAPYDLSEFAGLRSDIMYHAAKSIEANQELLQRLADEAPVEPVDRGMAALHAKLTAPLVMTVTPAPETQHYRRIIDEPVDQGLESVKDLLEGN